MIIENVNIVNNLELGDVIGCEYGYYLIVKDNTSDYYKWVSLSSNTVSTTSYDTIENLVENAFDHGDIVVIKSNNIKLLVK